MQVSDFIAESCKKRSKVRLCSYRGCIASSYTFSEKKQKLKVIFPIHEQTCAMAAEAYARVSKNIGAAFATSGSGATSCNRYMWCIF